MEALYQLSYIPRRAAHPSTLRCRHEPGDSVRGGAQPERSRGIRMPTAGQAGSQTRHLWRGDPRVRRALDTFGPAAAILVAQAVVFRQSPLTVPGLYLYGTVLGLLSAMLA